MIGAADGRRTGPNREVPMRIRFPAALAALLFAVSALPAHYSMLLPDKASAKKDEAVTLTYQFGHPFEHQLFDAPAPESLTVRAPDGKTTDLTKSLEAVKVPAGEGKTVTAYRLKFTPDQRGDYVFLLRGAPVWMEEDGEFLHDMVKVVLHVQAQKGWDANGGGHAFEWMPLTRPYGLQPGLVFQARTLPNTMVEVERYNAEPPKELPPDEQITRVVKSDPNGTSACTLPDAGWWALTAAMPGGTKEHEGKPRRVRERSTLWVYVDGK
jgi:cobalt/nickel transport protein